jgi:hypothetical protein
MKQSLLLKLFTLAFALLLGGLLCEGVARLVTGTDEDGQVFFRGEPLLPYRIPEARIREVLDYHRANRDHAYLLPDRQLGWTIAPDGKVESGIYRADSHGIRSEPREHDLTPPPGVLRIALFGDSFTHGDEVPYHRTWGRLLEDELKRRGVEAEVLNFGVPAYGLGQAYLRWNRLGREFSPRVAVLGFQVENIKRTLNIFRQLYSRSTGIPFSKPRFILDGEGELRVVNSPTVPPEEIIPVLKEFRGHPLKEHEYWYNPATYSNAPWFKSRFIRLLYTFLFRGKTDRKDGPGWLDPEGEGPRVTRAIIRRFAEEVRESGGIPVLLHTPAKSQVKNMKPGEDPFYYFILREAEGDGIRVVDPAREMMGESRLFKKRGHYSARGGEIVARVLADAIIRIIAEEPDFSATEFALPDQGESGGEIDGSH